MRDIDCLLVGYFGGSLDFDNPAPEVMPEIAEMKEFNAAIAYLGTFLHRKGFSFDYINYIEDEYDLLVQKLKKNNIKAVGISTTYCTDSETVRKLVKLVRNIDASATIILGGPHIANLLKYTSDKEVLSITLKRIDGDFYVNSFEGEKALANIINALKYKFPFDSIPNICYKNQGKFVFTELEEENNSLEENMVDWSLFADHLGEVVPVRTAISCPFACAYCNHPVNAGKYRYVSVEAVERELDSIESTQKVHYVDFVDDTFNVPKGRFKEILRLIIKKGYGFKWFSYVRCQFIDEEMASLMKESGCMGAMLGIESGSQKMLDGMNKMVTVEKLKRGANLLNEYGIPTLALFFIGFPGETYDTVNQTIQFIEDIKPTYYDVRAWIYDPKTPIGKQSKQYALRGYMQRWSHCTMNSATAEQLVGQAIATIKNSVKGKYSAPQIDKLLSLGYTLDQINSL